MKAKKHKAGFVAPKGKFKAEPSAKKGSDKPAKKAKHSKPKTTVRKGSDVKGEARMAFFKSKGFKAGS